MKYQFIDPEKISDMLFHDMEYVAEFCEAGIISFDEFIENFRTHLLNRNMEDLRKAGHKIKPGAQMMGAHEVVEKYEHAKTLLNNEAGEEELIETADAMQQICDSIKDELLNLAKEN